MSEVWRRKPYYDKRVLIETGRVLSPQFDDSLLCITGAQLEMLRNLTQYLKRRSTFASAYHVSYYDAPTENEWDQLQAIVADLEHTLMGCEELTNAVLGMAAQLACICQALQGQLANTQPGDPGYTDQQYYDEYVSDVEPDVGDPPEGFADWDEWHEFVCQAAQKLVDDARIAVTDMGTKLTAGILITFSVINAALLLSVIAAPVSIVIQIVTTLVAIGASFVYADVATWLLDNKETLVCDIYSASSAGAGYAAVQADIADLWDAGPGIQVVQALFNREVISSIFDGTMRDAADWTGDYTEAYCVPCGEYPEGYTWTWTWPPCPRPEFTDGGVCWGGMLCFDGGTTPATQKLIVNLETLTRIDFTARYKSMFGPGWTCGYVSVWQWNTTTLVWDHAATCNMNTTQSQGVQNETICQDDFIAKEGGLYRVKLEGAAGQSGSEPYPFELEYLQITFSLP